MLAKISAVINTFNEEKNIERAIKSILWVDEIIVCDMHSVDKTLELAKKLGAKIFSYEQTDYVEPARNFAISKATNNWILILDADEEIPWDLAKEIQRMLEKPIDAEIVEIPRKNIIFGKWIKSALWWPDYQVRFFKKGSVKWEDKIHSKPETKGINLQLPQEEKFAILHHNYDSVSQFVERMNRYTSIEANELAKQGFKFHWTDLTRKPLEEFLSRFFANKGYEDGLHGLALSMLQAFSFFVVYLKLWELSNFKETEISIVELSSENKKMNQTINWWLNQFSKNPFKKFFKRIKH